ncbi:site-specific integrase [Candidatus Falkowbacteria bacterium]|nr:MAG: site-specific integrase [Candidatus Falkowbacteria bacterium]
MTIYKKNNSYWVNIRFNRKRYRKPSPQNTLAGAKAYESLLRQKLARGEPIVDEPEEVIAEKTLFSAFAFDWFNTYVKNNNKLSEVNNKRSHLDSSIIPYFGKKYIDEITSYDIEKYKTYLSVVKEMSPKTINNRLCIISKCLKTAVEWGTLEYIPRIKLLKVPPQRFDYLTVQESELLLRTAKGQWRDMILLGLRTGLRFGEIVGLKWENIDFTKNVLQVMQTVVRNVESSPKSNKIRTVPLTKEVTEMLKDRSKDGKYIFQNPNGSSLQGYFCLRRLHEICREASLRNVGWHTLRHTFASRLAENNISILAVKELLGHSDIKTTMRYSHINLSVLQDSIKSLEVEI